jgi:hypothetical protein
VVRDSTEYKREYLRRYRKQKYLALKEFDALQLDPNAPDYQKNRALFFRDNMARHGFRVRETTFTDKSFPPDKPMQVLDYKTELAAGRFVPVDRVTDESHLNHGATCGRGSDFGENIHIVGSSHIRYHSNFIHNEGCL